MSMVIMVHTQDALKEFFLPAENNTDHRIVLENELFHWGEDLTVHLENVGYQWSFVRGRGYEIVDANGDPGYGRKLQEGERYELRMTGGQRASFLVAESEETFQIFHKFDISREKQIEIGSHSSNHIQCRIQSYISRNHALLQQSGGDWFLYDRSSNGTFLNSVRIREPRQLEFGDRITIFGLCIVYLGNVLAVGDCFGITEFQVKGIPQYYQADVQLSQPWEGEIQKQYFKRSPRNIETLHTDEVEIDPPPAAHTVKEKPLLMVIGPSFTMSIPMLLGSGLAIFSARMSGGGGVYMFTGVITALGSALLGVMWALANLKYNRNMEREESQLRYNAYGSYLIEIANDLKIQYEENRRILNERYLPGKVCCTYTEKTAVLWNRNFRHEDFLAVRLGLGSMPFQVRIHVPKKKFELVADELKEKPEQLKHNYETLCQVPVCIDLLRENLVGIVGGAGKRGAVQIVQNMAAQIAANNCYTDVKMVFFYQKETSRDEEDWGFARWLPHVWTEGKKVRLIAENKKEAGDVGYELIQILHRRMEDQERSGSEEERRPHYILFVEDMRLLEGEMLANYALNPKEEYGLTTVLMAASYEELPNCCENIIRNSPPYLDMYHVAESSAKSREIAFDTVDPAELGKMARRLSGVEVNEEESEGEIPGMLDFMEMYGISSVEELRAEERWKKNRSYDSMKALIGKKGGGVECYLDIHEKYHGPHGLVAGTTGSGKSETLQTYILSLAVNFSPSDIGFFIIDFKGGGMANLFSGLPHLIGQISNLSGNQINRAMISIKSEINRRQRLFTENGVNNINLYTRLYKNGETAVAIPHLMIIIDEFAELKREEPDFMKELISVAQVGRSLGVHLILATQKPAGTVDDNIWSNSKFRLCLRVQDRQDSNDMLHKPDAAYITQAGRCYLQVGNDEIFELFQSGYSGAAYEEDQEGGKGAIATMLNSSGRAAMVGNSTKRKNREKRRQDWLLYLYRKLKEPVGGICLREDPDRLEQQGEELFSKIQEDGWHFENNLSNRLRIQEFLSYMDMTREMDDEQAVYYLISYAEQMNRKLPEAKERTQLEAVVKYLGDVAREEGYQQCMTLWLPVLPKMLCLNQLEGYEKTSFRGRWTEDEQWALEFLIGLYDDPENQAQEPLVVSLSQNGHHAVCGTVVTGKSTFLQTCVYALIDKYSPQWLNLYLLDFSSHMLSCFEKAPQVGGIIYQEDIEKARKFFHMLDSMMDERKKILQTGNYSQYVKVNGVVIPAIVIVIDDYVAFREKTDNQYENEILRLSREGVNYGFYLLISAGGFGASGIPNRIGDNIRTVFSLEMGDRFKFAETLRVSRVEILPEEGVKGRGLADVNGRLLEFQTAAAVLADNDYDRSERLSAACQEMRRAWQGPWPKKIPHIPEKPQLPEFAGQEEYRSMVKTGSLLPFAYRMVDASYYCVDLRTVYCYLISGRARTGKTNALKVLIHAASQVNGEICIIESGKAELKKISETVGAKYISGDQEIFNFFKGTVETFQARNGLKRKLQEEGAEDEEIFEAMSVYTPIFIFVADIVSFVQSVYRRLENGSTMSAYIENITEKGRLHHFYFFGCVNVEEAAKVAGMKVYSNMTGYRTGVHLGGNLGTQKIFTFSNIPFAEQNKPMKPGLGLTPSKEDASAAEVLVVPMAKGV